MSSRVNEASQLINRRLDQIITPGEELRLNELMIEHRELVDIYIGLTQIHGQLLWGAGDAVSPFNPAGQQRGSAVVSRRPWTVAAAVVCLSIFVVAGLTVWIRNSSDSATIVDVDVDESAAAQRAAAPIPQDISFDDDARIAPLTFDSLDAPHAIDDRTPAVANSNVTPAARFSSDLTDEDVIAAIDQGIADVQRDNGMEPSPRATADEWVRRAYLTVAGRIPTFDETRAFAARPAETRRSELIVQLTASEDRNLHLAEFWTNLLIGRSERPHVNRAALGRFLADAFDANRPWIDVVGELISAEGRNDQNGATNFLLAHLDNQATPATAVTARLFLGEQLQCVQCHNHPFASGVEQGDYWALNAFFQDTHRSPAKLPMNAAAQPVSLADRPSDGTVRTAMTYYETLQGQQRAALPTFDGHKLTVDDRRDRRTLLAEFLAGDSQHRVARAMVNRMWAQFFGYGFTSPVDDTGPHVPVSHPEVLRDLTDAFVASGYDLKRLQTWIALSNTWQRTSQSTDANEIDDPAAGGMPLFTRVYIRRMSPEQMYDSIRVAIQSASGDSSTQESRTPHRREWVSQFVHPYDTDENDEATEFDGSIAQAMVMMNGTDVNQAIGAASRLLLADYGDGSSANDVLERVSRATLTRKPTDREVAAFRRQLKRLSRTVGRQQAVPTAVEDMMWAYLNSSEFAVVH